MHVKHKRCSAGGLNINAYPQGVGVVAIHQSRWIVEECSYDMALETTDALIGSQGPSVGCDSEMVAHDAHTVVILAHGRGLVSVKSVDSDLVSSLMHPFGMAHHPRVRSASIGDHHRHSDHALATPFLAIGCSLPAGGPKQFIMSGARLVFLNPKEWM